MRTVATLAGAGIAVVVGFFILRSVTDPADESDSRAATAAATSEPVSTTGPSSTTTTTTTTPPTTTTTTIAPRVSKSAATVVVANASGVDGSATAMTEDLEEAGYTTGEVSNSTRSPFNQTIIYYVEDDPSSLGVAARPPDQRCDGGVDAWPGRRRTSARRAADRLKGSPVRERRARLLARSTCRWCRSRPRLRAR